MKILAVETSSENCSCALLVDGVVIQRNTNEYRQHGQVILDNIVSLLAEASLTINQLDAIAIGKGPGAFTGLRIGIGVAQGFAYGADIPVIPVNSLQIIAVAATAENHLAVNQSVVACMDARMNEVYWCHYVVSDDDCVDQLNVVQLSNPALLIKQMEKVESGIIVGNGVKVYNELFLPIINEEKIRAIDLLPEAKYLAMIAAKEYINKNWVEADKVVPEYVRNKVTS